MRAAGPAAFRIWHAAIALGVTALGVAMRVTNARTIHGYGRVSDLPNTVRAVEFIAREHRLFDPGGELHNAYHGPLWYALAAPLLSWADRLHAAGWERLAIPAVILSVSSWLVRQGILFAAMREFAPARPWACVTALALHAVLPVSAYQDGVFYNEALHATLFAAAMYFLLRIERAGPERVRARDAVGFGLFAGLGMITKASSALLPMAAAALALVWIWRAGRRWPLVVRDVTRPALWAAGCWLATAGWWCASNFVQFGHPFPHQYEIRRAAVIANHPAVGDPVLYHRPFGWFLPVEFEFLAMPYAAWSRPNFWQQMVAGTWVDDINHGFCRMTGPVAREVWGWPVTAPCLEASRRLIVVGTFLTVVAVVACGALAWRFARSRGHRGSLVIPLVCAGTVALLALFGARYPFDHHPVIKAAYALHLAPLLCACVGLALGEGQPARGRAHRAARRALQAAIALSIVAVGVLVSQELWARR